jgi:hypothetical protein
VVWFLLLLATVALVIYLWHKADRADSVDAEWLFKLFSKIVIAVFVVLLLVGSFYSYLTQFGHVSAMSSKGEEIELAQNRIETQIKVVTDRMDKYPEYEADVIKSIEPTAFFFQYPNLKADGVIVNAVDRITSYNESIFALRGTVIEHCRAYRMNARNAFRVPFVVPGGFDQDKCDLYKSQQENADK